MVLINLADGFEEIEALTVVDLLRRAEVDARTVSLNGSNCVKGAHGIDVMTDLRFETADYEGAEMMVLPGGMPGAVNLQNHEGLKGHILEFDRQGKYLAAICAAPMVFGRHGILKGRRATIYPGMEAELKGAEYVESPVVRDGNLITSQGPATAMAFALELVAILKGDEVAREIKKGLLLER